jgi:dTDP-4-dehydrorhamnose 3,5-epimerase
MKIERTGLDGVLRILPKRFGDDRGWFSETFRRSALDEGGFAGGEFVQDNHVRSTRRGIVRGLHFQAPPHAQDKLVRCTAGAIFDVAVDIRRGSPTYGRWFGETLSAENQLQLLVPKGFAHGYCTLTDECEVLYKVTEYYNPHVEGSLKWNDVDVGINWGVPGAEVSTNARDATAPSLKQLMTPFFYTTAGRADA